MLGIIFFGLTVWAGVLIIRLIKLPLTRSEQLAAGAVVGLVIASWLGLVLSLLLGFAKAAYAVVIALMVTIAVILLKTRHKASQTVTEPTPGSKQLRLFNWLLIVITGGLLFWLAYGHFLPTINGNLMSAGYTWADLALHTTLISSFAKKSIMDLTLPIYAGSRLTYPFLVDFFSAQMLFLGSGWQWSLLLPTIILLYSFVRLFIGLTWRLTKSLRAAWIATIMVLLSGSSWGIFLFVKDVLQAGIPINQLLIQDYSKLDQNNLFYSNFLTSHLLPQRAYLFGIAVALVIFIALWQQIKSQRTSWSLVLLAGILLGSLPFIHTHSFLVVAGFIGLLWLARSWHNHEIDRPLLNILLIGGALALPQLIWQFGGSYHAGFSGWRWGWLKPENMNIVYFWLRQLGLAVILFGLGPYLLYRQRAGLFMKTIYWSGVGLFVVGNIYIFQPSAWDNMKFFTYAYWMMLLPATVLLASISRKTWGKVAVSAVLILTCGTGIVALAREARVDYVFASADDQDIANAIEREVPPTAVVLVDPSLHHNPVSMLAGRTVLSGYPGWLWSYGINYIPRQNDAMTMLAGGDKALELLRQYGVDYVAINNTTPGSANIYFLSQHFRQVINQNGWTVWQVR